MTIILVLSIPLAFIAGGFVAYKGVQLGLRWQVQVKHNEQPTLEIKNPVSPFIEAKQQKDAISTLDEYLNGPQESR